MMLSTDSTMSPCRAIEVGAAFPYPSVCHQKPLGEKVIINDLYGVTLYKPSTGPVYAQTGFGTQAMKWVIEPTVADPNFMVYRLVTKSKKVRTYKQVFWPTNDPGPMRYTCRVPDCIAFSRSRLSRQIQLQLPYLPWGVVPGGKDAWDHLWALMDCPADKVPEVTSAHSHNRVTIMVLVCFPPEPFYFPNMEHLDCALRYWTKLGRKANSLAKELDSKGKIEALDKVCGRLIPRGYSHSMPVQELLKEQR